MDGSLADACAPPTGGYHPSSVYYCDSYPRMSWLPPSDVFPYSNPLCKYRVSFSCFANDSERADGVQRVFIVAMFAQLN